MDAPRRLRTFWMRAGLALLALALAGAGLGALGRRALLAPLVAFDPATDVARGALGIACIVIALAPGARALLGPMAAFLLGAAALGALSPTLFGFPARAGLPLRLDAGENVIHAAIGAWAAYVATRVADEKVERN